MDALTEHGGDPIICADEECSFGDASIHRRGQMEIPSI